MLNEQSLDWVRKTWADVKLGDRRRNQRAIKLANSLLHAPAASLPHATLSWTDLKAGYRLLNENDVTHQALQENHWSQVINSAKNQSGPVLFIQDGSVLDYSNREATLGLGPIGNHNGDGINLHSCLAVAVESKAHTILGLAYQKVWVRAKKSKRNTETRSQRRKRQTEADIWSNWIPKIDSEQNEHKPWIFVGDRGNDIFKFVETCKENGEGFRSVLEVVSRISSSL